jgi:transcriptional regulator with XRE-family HTH domain
VSGVYSVSMNQVEMARHQELAEFLRSRRARLLPEQEGLLGGARRRTPGLRRAEVAMLAGVSLEWYTWLEQGRDIHVSVQVVESLARVLHLDANERAHLFVLALRQLPPVESSAPPTPSPILLQFLDHMGAAPTIITDPRLTVVAVNAAFRVVFGVYMTPSEQSDGDARMDERNRNMIWHLFTSPFMRREGKAWWDISRIYLAQFRAEYGRFITDPWWTEQITELSQISPEFRELWARHDVLTVTEGQKTMLNEQVGELTFDFLWLKAVDGSDLRLLMHLPRPNTGTTEKIAHLLACEAKQNT